MQHISFQDWTDYYEANKTHFSRLDWDKADFLTDAEYELLYHSLQQFQHGEYSEGKNLMRYARQLNDPEYLNTIRIFIREEQTHARILGKFMDLNDIPRAKSHWVDKVFRGLRRLSSLENSITVLLTAEIIAAVFYKALRDASHSFTLRAICKQILSDEEMHINFQAFTLKKFHDKKWGITKLFVNTGRRVLLSGTILVVWLTNGRVLRAGNYTLPKFWKECFAEFNRAQSMIDGKKQIAIRKMYNHLYV